MKMIRFFANFYGTDGGGNSRAIYEAGQDYPADDAEARRCIARGIAEEVDVADAPQAAETAEAATSEPDAAADKPAGKAKK